MNKQLNNETTAGHSDYREQLDLSTPHPIPGPEAPLYHNLLAPNQWPPPKSIPDFRPVFEEYMSRMSEISTFFTSLIAEALDMPATAFDRFFDKDQQHKLKIVKYPEGPDSEDPLERQGVGPHKDSMLTSYLLQASPQIGLQAQNTSGDWVDVKPIDGTLVVAIGQGLEALTAGCCASTTHRVLSPLKGEGPRFSVPFFQGVSYDARFEEIDVPEHVRQLRSDVLGRTGGRKDDVEFTFRKGQWQHLGEATLSNRVKSHPDVGERWVSCLGRMFFSWFTRNTRCRDDGPSLDVGVGWNIRMEVRNVANCITVSRSSGQNPERTSSASERAQSALTGLFLKMIVHLKSRRLSG